MKKFNFIIGLELKRICFCGEKARVRVYIRVISDSTTDFKLNDGKNRRFFIGGAVCIWIFSDSTTDFKLNNGKNPKGFFIGGAVYIWVISDSTSTFASPFSPDKPYRE